MLTDKRTIRTAIMKRIPEIYNVALLPGKQHIHIFMMAKIQDAIGRDYHIGIEEDEMPYQGSHNDLMNIVDRIADEVAKYKKTQLDVLSAAEKLLPANDEQLKLDKPMISAVKEAQQHIMKMDKLTNEKAEDERVKDK